MVRGIITSSQLFYFPLSLKIGEKLYFFILTMRRGTRNIKKRLGEIPAKHRILIWPKLPCHVLTVTLCITAPKVFIKKRPVFYCAPIAGLPRNRIFTIAGKGINRHPVKAETLNR